MTAFLNEPANNVWIRAQIFLASGTGVAGGIGSAQANEVTRRILEQMRMFLATQAFNPNLQLVSWTDAQATTAGGLLLGSGTPRLYAVYAKKSGTSGTGTATISYLKFYDDATDDTTASHERLALPLLAAAEEVLYISPTAVAYASGIVVGADTTIAGTTDSTAGDAGPGFIIVG
jgi:hypothetical protein